jgi:carboxyl-terminal processing protease
MIKKIGKIIAIWSFSILIGTTNLAYADHDTPAKSPETYKTMKLLMHVFEEIRKKHSDPVDDKKIIEAAIAGMAGALDAHSSYHPPMAFEQMTTSMEDDGFVGIGATISADVESGYIKVETPIVDSPAFKAGLLSGDLIISVNETSLNKKTAYEAVDLIRGKEGTNAVLEIIRKNKKLTITIVRAKIESQNVTGKIIEKIGYVKIAEFNNHVSDKVKAEIIKMKVKGLRGVILDFRFNPGGLLNEAISMVDLFIKSGVIVSTRERDVKNHPSFVANASDNTVIPLSLPMVVLINKGSASASEILAGSLQDLKRATIVGQKSYGKGSVQTLIPLPNRGALRLTTAKYYTASGKTIHGVGIMPDVLVEIPEDFKPRKDLIDPQLRKALDIIKAFYKQ